MTPTRIWYETGAINVSGVTSMPAGTLSAALSGDRVVVTSLSGVLIAQLNFAEYARQDGSGFASAADAKAYMDGEFAMMSANEPGPPGADGATWTVGSGAPSTTGNPRDLYLDTSTGDIYLNGGTST